MKTKKCKHCQSDIPANAKVCAQCGRKQGGKLKWIIIAVVILAIIGAVAGGGGSSDSTEPAASPASSAAAKTPVKYRALPALRYCGSSCLATPPDCRRGG